MTAHELNLQNLSELDGGKIPIAWRNALQRAIEDCDDAPTQRKPRKVILEMELTPVLEQGEAVLDSINADFKVKCTLPTRQSKTYNLGYRKMAGQGQLVFNDMSDDNIHQRTIDE